MITRTAKTDWVKLRQDVHADCVVCSQENKQGLNLDFRVSEDGQVTANFIYDKRYQGYDGILHGGIISAILDGAMTNCLFAQERIAVTADFRIRYRHPVAIGKQANVRAWVTRSTPPIFELKAEITQDNQVKTTATAKFMEPPRLSMDAKVETKIEQKLNH